MGFAKKDTTDYKLQDIIINVYALKIGTLAGKYSRQPKHSNVKSEYLAIQL